MAANGAVAQDLRPSGVREHHIGVEGPLTAGPAERNDLPCAHGDLGADGQRCPYREHALMSRQEHEAWDVLLACQGQLLLAPSGHVVGIDMSAALKLGAARGSNLAVLSELLPAAEAGLVEALSIERDEGALS
jgi:hypothetical protein